MIKGVYSPERFLEIFRDYIYFQDRDYDSDEKQIVCRYPQFFATRLLKESIVKSVSTKSGKVVHISAQPVAERLILWRFWQDNLHCVVRMCRK